MRFRKSGLKGAVMAKRGFFAELNYQAQQAEKRRRQQEAPAVRAHNEAVREHERAQKAAERARAAAARASDASARPRRRKPPDSTSRPGRRGRGDEQGPRRLLRRHRRVARVDPRHRRLRQPGVAEVDRQAPAVRPRERRDDERPRDVHCGARSSVLLVLRP